MDFKAVGKQEGVDRNNQTKLINEGHDTLNQPHKHRESN